MRIRKTTGVPLLAIFIAFGGSCSLQKSKATGESAVAKFHSQFNAEQYHEIYGKTDEGFRKATSEQEMLEYLRAIHRKLGEVKDAKQIGWHLNATTGGVQVFLAYKTSFSEGDATEQFVFLVSGDNSALFRYNIESPLFITK